MSGQAIAAICARTNIRCLNDSNRNGGGRGGCRGGGGGGGSPFGGGGIGREKIRGRAFGIERSKFTGRPRDRARAFFRDGGGGGELVLGVGDELDLGGELVLGGGERLLRRTLRRTLHRTFFLRRRGGGGEGETQGHGDGEHRRGGDGVGERGRGGDGERGGSFLPTI